MLLDVFDAEIVGSGLGRRLTDVRAAMERQSAFVFGGSEQPVEIAASDTAVARDFVLRSMATMVDPVNYSIMQQLEAVDMSIAEISTTLNLDHVVVWERANDMVQVGLMGRDLERDVAGLTPPGQQLLGLVEAITNAAELAVGRDQQ